MQSFLCCLHNMCSHIMARSDLFIYLYTRGVTTSRATSGVWRKDRNTSGQRVNKFNNSYRDISVVVAENNSVVKPKCQQYTSLKKMLSNFSKVLMAHIPFTAGNKQWRHRKTEASVASGKAPRRIIFTFCNLLCDEKRKPKPWSPNEFSHLAPKYFQIFRNFSCSNS